MMVGSCLKMASRSCFSIWTSVTGAVARMVAVLGWPVRADISPKKSPGPRVATLAFVAPPSCAFGFYEDFDLAFADDVEAVAGVILAEEDLAGGEEDVAGRLAASSFI